MKYPCYACDTQINMTFKPFDRWDDISSPVEVRTRNIAIWMTNSNMLKLNKSMNKLGVFSSRQHVKKSEKLRIKVGFSYINYSMSLRNLGLILDNTTRVEKQ